MLYDSVDSWMKAMVRHYCECKDFYPADDLGLKIGYVCGGCSERFQLPFGVLNIFVNEYEGKEVKDKTEAILFQLIKNTEGRIRLAKLLSEQEGDKSGYFERLLERKGW